MDGGKKHLFLVNISSHSQLIGPTKAPTVWGSKYTLSTEYTSSMRGQRLVKRKQLQRDIKFWVVKKKPTGLMVFQRAPLSYEMMPNSLVSDPTCSKIMYTSAHNVTNCHLSLHLFRGLKKHTHTNILTLIATVTTKYLTDHLSPYFSQQQSHPLDCDCVISQS